MTAPEPVGVTLTIEEWNAVCRAAGAEHTEDACDALKEHVERILTARVAEVEVEREQLRVELAEAERDYQRATERADAMTAVHARYFDLDGQPGVDDTTPEPEDVWRYDRDLRAALGDPS